MKIIISFVFILMGILCFTSCELDNYDAPGGSIYGVLLDEVTGDSIQSDIFDGARIALVEIDAEFENPQKLYQIIKTDGSFRNNLMFEGLYSMPSIQDGNFHPTDSSSITIDGETELILEVLPYIRISEANLSLNPEDSMELNVSFKLEQTTHDTIPVKSAYIYVYTEPTVGKAHSLETATLTINAAAVPDSLYSMTWNLSKARKLKAGNQYYFRVGALIDVDGAKTNYAKAVKLTPEK